MTETKGQQAGPVDPLASQRAEYLGKLLAAQSALERVIAQLARVGANTSNADAQLARLASLQASVGTASATDLSALGGEIAAAITQSQTIAQDAQQQITAMASADAALALASAAQASRAAADAAMGCLRNIPLTFTSAEDKAAYDQREEERRRYIAEQEAKHTPDGDLNASGAALGQMVDAKMHGASGPEFEQDWKKLATEVEQLRAQMRKAGKSTQEFDDHLRQELRQIMKSKGFTDAEINAQFAARPDPLDVAKAILTSDQDFKTLEQVTKQAAVSDGTGLTVAQDQSPKSELTGVMAKFQLAGITGGQPTGTSSPEHGLTGGKPDLSTPLIRR